MKLDDGAALLGVVEHSVNAAIFGEVKDLINIRPSSFQTHGAGAVSPNPFVGRSALALVLRASLHTVLLVLLRSALDCLHHDGKAWYERVEEGSSLLLVKDGISLKVGSS
jgi:hypothetical protein